MEAATSDIPLELAGSWGGRVTSDEMPWYAVRLFSLRQHELADELHDAGVPYFVPMEFRDVMRGGKLRKHVLMPVVHNLIFIGKDRPEKQLRALLSQIPYKLSVVKSTSEGGGFYEIPHREMIEFQTMCNPEIEMRKYLTEKDAKLKVGTPVLVKFGPLKGLTGKLVRSNHKYYLLKEVPGLGVMIKVSRWCCVPLDK